MTAHAEDDATDVVLDALARREIVDWNADPVVRLLAALVADVDDVDGANDYRLSSVSITPST